MHTKFAHILNAVSLLFSFIIAAGIISIQWSREIWTGISHQIFGTGRPVMDSVWLDANLERGMMVLFVLFLAWIIVKEIRIPSIYKRLRWNSTVLIGLTAYSFLLLYFIYAPVFQAG